MCQLHRMLLKTGSCETLTNGQRLGGAHCHQTRVIIAGTGAHLVTCSEDDLLPLTILGCTGIKDYPPHFP
jgi:hypothetical protein